MSELIVCKFGGSSITSKADLEQIARIMNNNNRRVVVLSAPGKRNKQDTKVTDMLIELARTKNKGLEDKIIERFQELTPGENISELRTELENRIDSSLSGPAYEDNLKAFGEYGSAVIASKLLGFCFVDPQQLFKVTNDFGNAKILDESTNLIRTTLRGLLDRQVLVVPGFYGHTEEGQRATFSRGGSDLTGAFISAALGAFEYENFTDTQGVFSADPGIVKDPKIIKEMTFKEMRNLSYSGFVILHQEAVSPVYYESVPMHIRSTHGYDEEGTKVVSERIGDTTRPIIGVAYKPGFCTFGINSFGLNDRMGVMQGVAEVFTENGVSLEYMPGGVDDVKVAVNRHQRDVEFDGKMITTIHRGIVNKLRIDTKDIKFRDHIGCLVVAGKGISEDVSYFSKVTATLTDARIPLVFLPQGDLDNGHLIYPIDEKNGKDAVNLIYDKYIR